MNTDELGSALMRAEIRVLEIQTKLHRWANDDPDCRFDDLFNLVVDPRFLLMAWAMFWAGVSDGSPYRTTVACSHIGTLPDKLI